MTRGNLRFVESHTFTKACCATCAGCGDTIPLGDPLIEYDDGNDTGCYPHFCHGCAKWMLEEFEI